MNNRSQLHSFRPARFGLVHLTLLTLGFCLWAGPVRAGLSINLHLYHDNNGFFGFPLLSTNTVTANNPTNTYFVSSGPGNLHGELDAGSTFSQAGSGYFATLAELVQELTNGNWSLRITNNLSTNLYSFPVSVTGLNTNLFAPVLVTFPTNGAVYITNVPTFTWQGPADWPGTLAVNENFIDAGGNDYGEASAGLPPGQTNWVCPVQIPAGTNTFEADYLDDVSTLVIANTPTNQLLQPLAGWVSTGTIETYYTSQFTAGTPAVTVPASGGHTLIAHYPFDDSGDLGLDASTNGNNLDCSSSWGTGPGHAFSTEAEAGGGAVQFFGYSSMTPCNQSFTNWTNALAGSFTVSLWVNTTTQVGNNPDPLNDQTGQSILYADSNGRGSTPVGITGSKAAFFTGDPDGHQDTLHSTNDVTTGHYVQIVVTRNQTTGEKRIYINGALDASDFASTEALTGDTYASIGGELSSAYAGLVDDVQIYSGVLNPTEVAGLFNQPGSTAPNVAGNGVNGLVAYYDFNEGTVVAPDVSGNGNNIVLAGEFNGNGPAISSQAVAGTGAVAFDGGSFLTAPAALLPTLAGSFTVSLWLNTTQSFGNQGDYAFNGAGVVAADVPALANDLVPVALTGGQVAFNTGNVQGGYDDTINSSATVNDGAWHHVAVIRNQVTGEKDIYIDGVLDTSDFDTTNMLSDPQLLTIGALADASNPDPASPDSTGYNGYQGLLDDLQIYDRPLYPGEISFLHTHPGLTLAAFTNTPYPVSVSLQLTLSRSEDPNLGEYYSAGMSFNLTPAPTTTNSIQSPNNYFVTEQYPSGGQGTSAILGSLGDLLNEFTNGFWKIYVNQNSPMQEVYSFQVAVSGLDTNLLPAIKVYYPTNGAVSVTSHPVFYWVGPTNYSTLQIELLNGPVAYPPVTATNWPNPPTVNAGPNRFDVDYNSNNFPGVTFTTPVDAFAKPISNWTATATLNTESFNYFVVTTNAVRLINPQTAGTNFQVSFLSQAGVTGSVQYRTNLLLGNWLTYTNVAGDGSLKTIPVPRAVFNGSPQGFIRISSQ
jgi:hypothetical protein